MRVFLKESKEEGSREAKGGGGGSEKQRERERGNRKGPKRRGQGKKERGGMQDPRLSSLLGSLNRCLNFTYCSTNALFTVKQQESLYSTEDLYDTSPLSVIIFITPSLFLNIPCP